MKLTNKQKKYLRNNFRFKSDEEMAGELKIPVEDVRQGMNMLGLKREPKIIPSETKVQKTDTAAFAVKGMRTEYLALLVAIITFVIFVSGAALYKYLHYVDIADAAAYEGALWHFINGNGLWNAHGGWSTFGTHLQIILFFYLPFYYLYPHLMTVMFLQAVFVGLGAVPLFLIVKRVIKDPWAPLFIAILYLLYPATSGMCVTGLHFEVAVIPFLFFLFYFYKKNNLKMFIIAMVLVSACKENHALMMAILGIYFLWKDKKKTYGVLCMGFGLLWFLTATKVVMPQFTGGVEFLSDIAVAGRYQSLGGSYSSIFEHVVKHPVSTISFILSNNLKVQYLLVLFVPHMFLSVFGWQVLIFALPLFAQNLLADFIGQYSLLYQYNDILIALLFLAFVEGLSFCEKKALARSNMSRIKFLLVLCTLATLTAFYYSETYAYVFHDKSQLCTKEFNAGRRSAIEKISRKIPADEALMVSRSMEPHFTHRKGRAYLITDVPEDLKNYILFDGECLDGHINLDGMIDVVSTHYRMVESEENIFLFVKNDIPEAESAQPVDKNMLAKNIYDGQIIAYRKFIQDYPEEAVSYNNRIAIIYASLGQTDEAVNIWNQLLAEDPDHIGSNLNLAITYLNMGNTDQSKALLARVLQSDPKNESARELIEQISRNP